MVKTLLKNAKIQPNKKDKAVPSVIYGETIYQIENSKTKNSHSKKNLFKIPNHSNPKYRMLFCHQSVFVKTSLLKNRPFDLSFKICADNDFFTELYHKQYKFYKVNQIISIYNFEGFSSKNFFRLQFENFKIAQKYNKIYFLTHFPELIYTTLKYFIKICLPKSILQKIKARLYEKI